MYTTKIHSAVRTLVVYQYNLFAHCNTLRRNKLYTFSPVVLFCDVCACELRLYSKVTEVRLLARRLWCFSLLQCLDEMRFDVLAAVRIQIVVFRVMTMCS
jgi:hypothetical protein